METDYGMPITQTGMSLVYPNVSFVDTPTVPKTPHVNLLGGNSSRIITVTGSVITQITNNFQDGINKNYPGT